jgi:hypothetical protein
VTIQPTALSGSSPTGYTFLGEEVVITAPPATPGGPIKIELVIDSSALVGVDPNLVHVFRDGVLVPDCIGSTTAVGTPPSFACLTSRALIGGNLHLTVLTAMASIWNVAVANPTPAAASPPPAASPPSPSPPSGRTTSSGGAIPAQGPTVSGAVTTAPFSIPPAILHARRSTRLNGFLGLFSGQPHRSQVVSSVAPLSALDFSPRHLASNFSLALLFVLLSWFPAELINAVLREHHWRIAGQLGRHERHLRRFDAWLHSGPQHLMFVGFVLFGALVYGFLDPRFGLNPTSLVLVAGIAAGLAVITLAHELVRGWFVERRHRVAWELRTFPIGIALAIVLVVISRIANFEPGYAFGLVCGVVFRGKVADRDDGRSLAVATGATLALATAAWLIWIPIRDSALNGHASATVLFLDAMLAFVWIFAIQTVMFSMIPLRYLDGERIRSWSKRGWLGLYLLSMFVFVEALVHPGNRYGGQSSGTIWSMLIIFVVFTGLAVAFWGWFRFEHWRAKREPRDQVKVG